MPVCHYFLKGMCTNLSCPYTHVKVNERAEICPDFLKGYCPRGPTCKLKHVKGKKKARVETSLDGEDGRRDGDIVEEVGNPFLTTMDLKQKNRESNGQNSPKIKIKPTFVIENP